MLPLSIAGAGTGIGAGALLQALMMSKPAAVDARVDRCRLFYFLAPNGDILATLGSEKISLRIAGELRTGAIMSNTYSLKPGTFSFLLMHWMRSIELGIMFPGNALLREMLDKQRRWRPILGLRTYYLNWGYPNLEGDSTVKRLLKPVARRLGRIDASSFTSRIEKSGWHDYRIVEERDISDEMADRRGDFGFRLEETPNYLNWRFSTNLSHINYRIFRLLKAEATCGYVVVSEWPHRLVISHCDGDDPEELALGVLLAIAAVNNDTNRYRQVVLSSLDKKMCAVFDQYGFRPNPSDTPFYLANVNAGEIPADARPGDWLVNLDMGDAGTVMGMVYAG